MKTTPPSSRIVTAIQHRYGEVVSPPDNLPGCDALAVMNERAVCRRYRADPVPPALLRLLCATALASPTKSDLQQASVIRVAPGADRAAIDALFPGSPWIANAPEFLVFCADGFRLRRLFARRGRAFPNEHLDAFFNATVDGAIVLSTFVQAAGLAGLGTCPISEIRNYAAEVDELLGLPDWVFPVAGLALGWPEALEPPSPRLALSATVHDGRYGTATVDRELDAYDARRMRERPYRQQRLTERFGDAASYGWSEDKARQYSEPQRAEFGTYIRAKRYRLD